MIDRSKIMNIMPADNLTWHDSRINLIPQVIKQWSWVVTGIEEVHSHEIFLSRISGIENSGREFTLGSVFTGEWQTLILGKCIDSSIDELDIYWKFPIFEWTVNYDASLYNLYVYYNRKYLSLYIVNGKIVKTDDIGWGTRINPVITADLLLSCPRGIKIGEVDLGKALDFHGDEYTPSILSVYANIEETLESAGVPINVVDIHSGSNNVGRRLIHIISTS